MAKRTLNQLGKVIARRVDKDPADTAFVAFAEECLVLTLQEIISLVPYAKWIGDEDTINTVSGQQYSVFTTDADPDNIVGIRDETNNKDLVRISLEDANRLDPGRDMTGPPDMFWFQRVGTDERIYWLPRPDAIIAEKMIFGNVVDDPASGSTSVLPAKYESIWIDGAMAKLFPRIPDVNHEFFQKRFMGGYDQSGQPFGIAIIVRDAKKARNESSEMSSHRPNIHTGEFGPRFPANFDITP